MGNHILGPSRFGGGVKADLRVGDVFAELAKMAETGEQVDLVVTSPPFLLQRSYLPADHPAKKWEHGQEPTPASWLATQLDVIHACELVLSPTGSIAWESGDKRPSGGAGGDYDKGGLREGQNKVGSVKRHVSDASLSGRRSRADDAAAGITAPTKRPGPAGRDLMPGWPRDKSICCLPWALAMSLAYGRNILAEPPSAREVLDWVDEQVAGGMAPTEAIAAARDLPAGIDGSSVREFDPWRVRNVVAWVRPNPPVGELRDRWRDGTSYITIATKSKNRWWDEVATRVPMKGAQRSDNGRPRQGRDASPKGPRMVSEGSSDGSTAPLLDWWELTNSGTKVVDPETGDGHFACWPPEITRRLILAMCPLRVCRICNEPSRRAVKSTPSPDRDDSTRIKKAANCFSGHDLPPEKGWQSTTKTTGWTTCGCPGADGVQLDGLHAGSAWRPGRALDPYAGTGTSLHVANLLGRDAVGIDLNQVNARLFAQRRTEVVRGMFGAPKPNPVPAGSIPLFEESR